MVLLRFLLFLLVSSGPSLFWVAACVQEKRILTRWSSVRILLLLCPPAHVVTDSSVALGLPLTTNIVRLVFFHFKNFRRRRRSSSRHLRFHPLLDKLRTEPNSGSISVEGVVCTTRVFRNPRRRSLTSFQTYDDAPFDFQADSKLREAGLTRLRSFRVPGHSDIDGFTDWHHGCCSASPLSWQVSSDLAARWMYIVEMLAWLWSRTCLSHCAMPMARTMMQLLCRLQFLSPP